MPEKETNGYLSVGQLARKMGVTVRTIQYYDQQGLLTPSAKGQNNQRLYTLADQETLCRILVLKYLGMSLADIRAHQDALNDSDAFRRQIGHTLAALENDFEALIKRLSIVRKMLSDSEEEAATDWCHMVELIEDDQPEEGLWRAVEAIDAAPPAPQDNPARGLAIGKWHELIADAIGLVSAQVPVTDPRARALAQRYLDLQASQSGSLEDSFLLMENISPHRSKGASGSFDVLRQNVSSYLDRAAQALGEDQDR